MAAGAEADTAAVLSQAEDEGWTKAELYASPPLLSTFSRITSLIIGNLIDSSYACVQKR